MIETAFNRKMAAHAHTIRALYDKKMSHRVERTMRGLSLEISIEGKVVYKNKAEGKRSLAIHFATLYDTFVLAMTGVALKMFYEIETRKDEQG